ncbi:IS701 family transposase [Kitasatospora sp. NPDC090308]|uniref:IS701 family transposase n=1 Tax=Kitasatospora sp. NPDC090308 TaxID=3364082 RepID=UPI003809742D
MTTNQNAAAVQATVTHEVWRDGSGEVMGLVAGCFPRRETRRTFAEMTEALLMGVERANCWTLAEAAGHPGPHRLQHFLARAVWDHDATRDRIARWTADQLAHQNAVLVMDETGEEKSSTDAVAAARQYSGALGGIGLCQVAVHLTYATPAGHALIDRALYLTRDWAADDERRELTGVPDELAFATKPQLAAAMLQRAREAGLEARWVTADEVYGGRELRQRVRQLGYGYAIAVPAAHRVDTPAGRFPATALLARLPRQAWQRLRTGHGTKGDRHYDWAMISIDPDDTPPGHGGGHSLLLVRRHRYIRELSFYRCHFATSVALADLVAVVCTRWRIEEDFAAAKSLTGLDQGQVTCWNSWTRWSLVSLVAAALLAVALARTRPASPGAEAGLIPLTRPELLNLLRAVALPTPRRDLGHVLHRSQWRRRHQHRAAACHRRWNKTTAAAIT